VKVLEEPEGPRKTKFGEKLVFVVQVLSSGERFRWFVPYREEVGEDSLLGQLLRIRNEHGKLKGLRLKVEVFGRGSSRRYSVEALGRD